jgi:hypothetical protein
MSILARTEQADAGVYPLHARLRQHERKVNEGIY